MSFLNASKYKFAATRSRTYLALIASCASLQLVLLWCFPQLLPLSAFCLVAIASLLWHWRHYQPEMCFSAEQLAFKHADEWLAYRWLANSRVALGCCLVVATRQDKLAIKVIFADSISDDVYRKLCFIINFPKQASDLEST